MNILIIAAVVSLLIFATLWLILQPKRKLQEAWEEVSASLAPKQEDLATPFKAWVQTSLEDEPVLQKWLLSLSEESLQALAEKVAEFCQEMNIELDWVIDPEADISEKSKKNAASIVTDYCKICLKAVNNQNSTETE